MPSRVTLPLMNKLHVCHQQQSEEDADSKKSGSEHVCYQEIVRDAQVIWIHFDPSPWQRWENKAHHMHPWQQGFSFILFLCACVCLKRRLQVTSEIASPPAEDDWKKKMTEHLLPPHLPVFIARVLFLVRVELEDNCRKRKSHWSRHLAQCFPQIITSFTTTFDSFPGF